MRAEADTLCQDLLPVLSDASDDVAVKVLVLLATIAADQGNQGRLIQSHFSILDILL